MCAPIGNRAARPATVLDGVRRAVTAAFTLVELLAVIAVVAILAAILLPTVSSARTAATRARTRATFAQWATAIESFRQEYGAYPVFADAGTGANKVNGNTPSGGALSDLHVFHDALVGARRDGSALPSTETDAVISPATQNPRRISFLSFTDSELAPDVTEDTAVRGLIHDAFGNPDIAVVVDRDLDGRLTAAAEGDIASLPAVSPPDDPTVHLQPDATDFPRGAGSGGGVRGGVIFYCAPPHARTGSDLILSWK